jgi:TldD protein
MNEQCIPYRDHFFLSPEELERILGAALSKGGDFAEIFMEYRTARSLGMEEDIIKDTAESIDMGLGIRVIAGDQTGYGYTNDLRLGKILKAAATAANIAKNDGSQIISRLKPAKSPHNLFPVAEAAHKAGWEQKIALVKRTYEAAQTFDPKIVKVKAGLGESIRYIQIVNSEGLLICDVRPMVRLACWALAEDGNQKESGYSGGGGRIGLEYFRSAETPEDIGTDAARQALQLLDAALPPAGEMPVVLSPGHSGVLIHEAVGHLLEADFIRKKTSVFWDKMGTRIGSELVNIYDDPTIPHFRGSYNIDDEGTIPRKTLLVERGKLRGLLQDRLSAKLMGMPLTGHGRREDFSCIPIPRMSNTFIDSGEHHPEEIISSVKKGFYAHRFQGGQVEDSGKFTFSVSLGFLIEDGRLTKPVKQATLIGSNIDILKKIDMVGSDLDWSPQTGTCGKEGQEAPVMDGCPTLKISGMTVGGHS